MTMSDYSTVLDDRRVGMTAQRRPPPSAAKEAAAPMPKVIRMGQAVVCCMEVHTFLWRCGRSSEPD